jgi:hypothetical protein
MEDLKQRLQTDLSFVEVVYFDEQENWYLHKSAATKISLTRDEILGKEDESLPNEESVEKKTFKRKK